MEDCTALNLSGISSSGKFLNTSQRRYYRGPSESTCEWSNGNDFDALSVSGSFGNKFSRVSSACCDQIALCFSKITFHLMTDSERKQEAPDSRSHTLAWVSGMRFRGVETASGFVQLQLSLVRVGGGGQKTYRAVLEVLASAVSVTPWYLCTLQFAS